MIIDTELWLDAITTVGFPIVAFFMIFWLCSKILWELIHEVKNITKALREIESSLNHRPPSGPF